MRKSPKKWSEEEINILTYLHSRKESYKLIAILLGRNVQSIKNKLHKIKVSKGGEYADISAGKL